MTSLRTKNQIVAALIKKMSANNGLKNLESNKRFNVAPTVTQRTEEKVRQQFAFLNQITTTPTRESQGQILSLLDGQTITKRSDNNANRRPTAVGSPVGRDFSTVTIEQDILIEWNVLLQWGVKSEEFYKLYRDWITRQRALGLQRLMFYGQSYESTVDSDPSTNLMGEDVTTGFLQYLIATKSDNVLGITPDASAKGYAIAPIKIGSAAGADYPNIAALVEDMRSKLPLINRGDRSSLSAIIGDSLRTQDISKVIAAAGDTATERNAVEAILRANDTSAGLSMLTPDEFPSHCVVVTALKNFDYIYQEQSIEREINENHNQRGIVDYSYKKADFVIKNVDACIMVHPDSIQNWNGTAWVHPQASQWFIEPPAAV